MYTTNYKYMLNSSWTIMSVSKKHFSVNIFIGVKMQEQKLNNCQKIVCRDAPGCGDEC